MQDANLLTSILAIYAAVMSTAAIVWNIYVQGLRERVRVRFQLSTAKEGEENQILFIAANARRRPFSVVAFGLDGHMFAWGNAVEVTEGKSHVINPPLDAFKYLSRERDLPKKAWVQLANGRKIYRNLPSDVKDALHPLLA